MYRPNVSQEDAILQMLVDARGCWVSLPRLLRARGEHTIVANIGARMTGLRKKGHVIENQKTTVDGRVYSEYRLILTEQTVLPLGDAMPLSPKPRRKSHDNQTDIRY